MAISSVRAGDLRRPLVKLAMAVSRSRLAIPLCRRRIQASLQSTECEREDEGLLFRWIMTSEGHIHGYICNDKEKRVHIDYLLTFSCL